MNTRSLWRLAFVTIVSGAVVALTGTVVPASAVQPFRAAPITVLSPADDAQVDRSHVEVTGTAEPGARVTLALGNTPIGSAIADRHGAWAARLTRSLPYGESTLRAQQTVGTIHVPATASVTVTVPVASPRVVKPEDGDTATTGTPTFSGKGVSGAEVALVITCDDGFMLDGSTKVNPYGKWSVTPNDELPKGTCTITAAQGINSVTSAETDPIPFTVDILSVANPNHQELQRNDRDTASEDDEDDLPDTGLPSMNLLTLVSGVFLLGLGSAMYVRSRRWASGRL